MSSWRLIWLVVPDTQTHTHTDLAEKGKIRAVAAFPPYEFWKTILYKILIGDYSYKGIIDEFNESIYISNKIKDQKNFRIKEFKKKFN